MTLTVVHKQVAHTAINAGALSPVCSSNANDATEPITWAVPSASRTQAQNFSLRVGGSPWFCGGGIGLGDVFLLAGTDDVELFVGLLDQP
jgi:hypothetical protein